MGTPILFGLKFLDPLAKAAAADPALAGMLNFTDFNSFATVIGQWVTLMHGPMAIILPIFMLGFLTRFYGKNKSWSEGFAAWKFCLFAAVSFLVPYLTFAWLVGPEFPSLIGGLVGLGIIVAGAKPDSCVPKDTWDFGPQSTWDASWTGTIATQVGTEFKPHMSQFKAWLPYILIGAILVVTRVPALGLEGHLGRPEAPLHRPARLQGCFRLHRLPVSARHHPLHPGRHPDHFHPRHEG